MRVEKERQTRDTDLAYAAGILDGEGCVGLYLMHSPRQKPSYQLRIGVHSTDSCVIQWLKDSFGGYTYYYGAPKGRGNCKPQWQWLAAANKALKVLQLVYPYLKLKKPQADIGIAFQSMRRGSGYHLSESEISIAGTQCKAMSRLNQRGVVKNKEEFL